MGLAKRKTLKYYAQPLPYFASQISKLVDFNIELVPTKKDADSKIQRSIKKAKLKASSGSDAEDKQLAKFVKAELEDENYQKSLVYNRGYIEVKED